MIYEFENWKPIYGIYEVSNYGRVKSIDHIVPQKLGSKAIKKGRFIKPNKYGGYLYVQLWIDGKNQTISLHRLVAETFIPNPYKLPEVNHRDENPNNCCVWNLEWCTRAYNLAYGHHNEKLSKPIIQLSKNGEIISKYSSTKEASEITGICYANISQCCNGKRKSAGGYVWQFSD